MFSYLLCTLRCMDVSLSAHLKIMCWRVLSKSFYFLYVVVNNLEIKRSPSFNSGPYSVVLLSRQRLVEWLKCTGLR